MQDLDTLFRGARITQVGLGRLGRGTGDAAFLARHGAELIVTDIKSDAELAASIAPLQEFPNVTFRLGGHDLEDFRDRDLILKGAGVPLDSPFIAEARARGIPVDMSASLFARIASLPLIGVTGTRGKSTVTRLVAAMLRADGREVLVGGNVQGVSNLALLEEVTSASVGVFELDSWQCQGLGEERSLAREGVQQGPISPPVAVFTTFMEDHLNYYDGSMERYLADKASIFLMQSDADVLVVGTQAFGALAPYKSRIRAHVVVADESGVPGTWNVRLKGAHNRYNIGIAIAAARAFGTEFEAIRLAAEAFEPLPGRLELVRTVRGVTVYNDTNATTPVATAASLAAVDPDGTRNVVLIAGGADKGLDPGPLADAISRCCKHVVLLPGTGTERLLERCALTAVVCTKVETLEAAAEAAYREADGSNVVLFSPGFASHGMFNNEYERGERFLNVIRGW